MIIYKTAAGLGLSRKDQGFAEKLLPVLLSTGLVFGLIILSGQFLEIFRAREEVDQVARAYLLEMETKGHLTEEQAESLKEILQRECGLSDIDLGGTTISSVDYGERIQLVISGNLRRELGIQIPFISYENRFWKIPIHVKMFSTAKH